MISIWSEAKSCADAKVTIHNFDVQNHPSVNMLGKIVFPLDIKSYIVSDQNVPLKSVHKIG